MLKLLLALVFVVILIVPGATWWIAQRPVPLLEGVGVVSGLEKPVLIRYDSRAIPSIKTDSDEDLFAAQGYVVARERMFQMDMLRRAAEGRIAQVFGLAALPSDRLMRTIGFERLAEQEVKYLSPQAKLALDAYTRGVNAYLNENADKLSAEFTLLGYKPEGWRDVDSLAIMKYLSYELDSSWKLDELRWQITNKVGDTLAARIFNDDLAVSSWSPDSQVKPGAAAPSTATPKVPGSQKVLSPRAGFAPSLVGRTRTMLPRRQFGTSPSASLNQSSTQNIAAAVDETFLDKFAKFSQQDEFLRKPDRSWGSTSWVLSPAYSKSGGAMLAADKHTALTAPCEYFLCTLISNRLQVSGAAIPGVPGIAFGRNRFIAWSGASMHADVQDLFVEHFSSEFESKYKTLGKIEVATELRESIPVRFGKDVENKITTTRHGPILLRDKESAIALSWTGFETKRPYLNALCAMNAASSWEEFSSALSNYSGSPQLFCFADKRGNVGCHAAGIIPIRAGGAQGTTMTEGWLSKGEWVSNVAYDDLPHSYIPAGSVGKVSGDFCVAAGQKLLPGVSGQFPENWGHQWDPPYRANRLALSLPKGKNAQKLDLFDFTAYQGDELNMVANLVVSELKKSMDANKSIDAVQQKAMNVMQGWDNTVKRDSVAATVYESFMSTLARRILEPKLGRELTNQYFQNWPLWSTFVEDYLRHKPNDLLSEDRTHDTFLLTTFAKANTRLKLLFKTDDIEGWKWEKAHLANFKAVGLQGLSWMRYIFDINGIGVGGDSNCLNACDVDRQSVGGPFQSNNGPTVRLLIDMADDDAFYGNLSLGQSGHYFSPFRQDQLRSWLRADPLPIAFSEAQIDKQCRHKFYLSAPGYR